MSDNTYYKFLKLMQAVNNGFGWPKEISQTTMLMLEIILVMHKQNKTLTVSQALTQSAISSPSSNHTKLLKLHELDLINYVYLGKNRRIKYLFPTRKAERYFNALGEALKMAAI